MHKLLLLLSTILLAETAFAGGSILGHKRRSNPYGVNAINVHVCSELECPRVRIISGDCTGEHMEMRWGVCICEAGYVASNGVCDLCPAGQYSDGFSGCQPCGNRTYKVTADATVCMPCPDDYATACADITGISTACANGTYLIENSCVIPTTGYNGATKGDGAVCTGTGGECQVCLKNYSDDTAGTWFDSDAKCVQEGEVCVNGACKNVERYAWDFSTMCKCMKNALGDNICGGGYGGITCSNNDDCSAYGTLNDGSCTQVTAKRCLKNSDCSYGEYCNYSGYIDCDNGPYDGVCVAKESTTGRFPKDGIKDGVAYSTAEAEGYVRSSGIMEWYTAQNFCRSYNKNLVTLVNLGINFTGTSCSGNASCGVTDVEASALKTRFGNDIWVWTNDKRNCNASGVDLDVSQIRVQDRNISSYLYFALCR